MFIDNILRDVFGSLMVRQNGDTFSAAVKRGRVWAIANQAGVASQAGLSATTPVLTLANPVGSGVRGKLWYAAASADVAFAAAATVYLAAGAYNATAVTGTLTTAQRNLKLGAAGPMSSIRCFLAATLPAAPVAIDILGAYGTGAITVPLLMPAMFRWYDGSVLIEEGCNLSIQTSTAAGTVGLWTAFFYEEEDK